MPGIGRRRRWTYSAKTEDCTELGEVNPRRSKDMESARSSAVCFGLAWRGLWCVLCVLCVLSILVVLYILCILCILCVMCILCVSGHFGHWEAAETGLSHDEDLRERTAFLEWTGDSGGSRLRGPEPRRRFPRSSVGIRSQKRTSPWPSGAGVKNKKQMYL